MKKFNYYLILFIIFALPSYLVRFDIFGIPTTLLEILIYLSAIITIVCSSKFKVYSYSLEFKFLIPIILFFVGGVIGTIIAPDKMTALGQFKAYIFDPLLFFYIILTNINHKNQINSIVYALFFSGILVSVYSIWQYLTGQVPEDGRIVGIFGYSPNYTAFYLAPIFISSIICFYFQKTKLFVNILKVIGLIIIATGLLLTESRAAILSVIGAPLLVFSIKYIFGLKNKSYKTIFSIFLILIIIVVGYFLIRPDFSVTGTNAGRIGSSNNIRWEIYKTTITHIVPSQLHWFTGVGLGNYQNYFTSISSDWVNYPEYIAPKALTAHNLLLSTYMNIGLIGLIGFVWILILFFKNIKLNNLYLYIYCLAMIVILIQGLVDTPYWKNDLSVMFWLFIAIVFIIKKNKISI